jgi:hypothetical protein
MNKYVSELITIAKQNENIALKLYNKLKSRTDKKAMTLEEKIKIYKMLNGKNE